MVFLDNKSISEEADDLLDAYSTPVAKVIS